MSNGVEFDEDKFSFNKPVSRPGVQQPTNYGGSMSGGSVPPLAQWMISKHIVKSAAAAQGVLIGLVVVNIIITFVVIRFFL